MRTQDTYKEVRVFEFPGGESPPLIARVYIPDLTPEERQRRMKQIHKAAAELIMSLERKKKNEVGQSV